jgi:hypothetical protein
MIIWQCIYILHGGGNSKLGRLRLPTVGLRGMRRCMSITDIFEDLGGPAL